MLRRFASSALAALTLAAAPALLAQENGTAAKPKQPAMSATPWPDDDVLPRRARFRPVRPARVPCLQARESGHPVVVPGPAGERNLHRRADEEETVDAQRAVSRAGERRRAPSGRPSSEAAAPDVQGLRQG